MRTGRTLVTAFTLMLCATATLAQDTAAVADTLAFTTAPVTVRTLSALTTYPPRILTSYPPRGAGVA
jgi:hypothetical protein